MSDDHVSVLKRNLKCFNATKSTSFDVSVIKIHVLFIVLAINYYDQQEVVKVPMAPIITMKNHIVFESQ